MKAFFVKKNWNKETKRALCAQKIFFKDSIYNEKNKKINERYIKLELIWLFAIENILFF